MRLTLSMIIAIALLDIMFTPMAPGQRELPQKAQDIIDKLTPKQLRMSESKPITVNEASFSLVAEREWKPKPSGAETPVEIQLRIKNLRKTEVIFRTFDTFGLSMTTADGTRVKESGGRDGTTLTAPISIAGESSYSLCRRAVIHWVAKEKAAMFTYYDGTGSIVEYGPLTPGKYQLTAWYHVNVKDAKAKEGAPLIWSGKVETQKLEVEISAP